MSFEITTAHVQQYKAGLEALVQQQGSRLRGAVRVEDQMGKASFYDQIDATTVRKRTVRHGDSPFIPTPHARRMNVIEDFDWGDFIDNEDQIRILNDPTSAYVQAASWAMGRAMDQAIIDAAFGTAQVGETGSTSLTFSADLTPTAGSEEGRTIVHNSQGLTVAKLTQAKELLDDSEVEPQPRFIACTAAQISDLLATTAVTSADFNTVKTLVAGDVDTFMGFKFIRIQSSLLPVDATPTRDCIAWAKNGLLLGLGKDITAEITRRADKGYSTYAFASMTIGATRMQGPKVIKIECNE